MRTMTLGALTRSVVTVGMVMLFTACDKDKEMDDDNGDLPFCESLIGKLYGHADLGGYGSDRSPMSFADRLAGRFFFHDTKRFL